MSPDSDLSRDGSADTPKDGRERQAQGVII